MCEANNSNKWQYTTGRGLKKCSKCGEINGQRAQHCRNQDCVYRKQALAFHPVQLVSQCNTTAYSLRSKERDAQSRNFVDITDVNVRVGLSQPSFIVSRSAVCHVDICKRECIGISSCKHVKACSVPGIPFAEVYEVQREVVANLNISNDQKQSLWNAYKASESEVSAVQRLNESTFVVKCVKSKVFPAGRLHITLQNSKLPTTKRSGTHACACKMLKIIVEPDNSLVMQDEICDHLLLLLAAILSKPNGKLNYEHFTNALKSFWMPEKLEMPLSQDDAFLGMHINISGDFNSSNEQKAADDIVIFGNEFLLDDKLPDFTDAILNVEHSFGNITGTAGGNTATTTTIMDVLPTTTGDPNLISSRDISEHDIDMHLDGASDDHVNLQLSDCNIELMDEFQLTDQIDLCGVDFTTIPESNVPINILTPPVFTETIAVNSSAANTTTMPVNAAAELLNTETVPLPLPPIELPTIAVVKKLPIRAANVVTEVKTRRHPHVPAKRKLIINDAHAGEFKTKLLADACTAPALAYSTWLDFVIESVNACIAPLDLDTSEVHKSFQVHKETFAHFCKSFSTGIKRRMPDEVAVIQSGKFKGNTKYVWAFYSAATVKRIFTTQNLSLQIERAFERCSDGSYIAYVRKPVDAAVTKKQRIYPKLRLYMTQIVFDNANDKAKCMRLTWIPDVYPKSQFGVLNLNFNLHTRDPNIF